MTKFLPLLFLFACASSAPRATKLPAGAVVVTKSFSTPVEAKNFIRNKWNYINILFEQSHDPYYGTPRWPEDCLKRHEFGKITEASGNSFFLSRLLLNAKNEPGDCQGHPSDVIYLNCKDEALVHEIICPPGTCANLISDNPCPLKK